MIKYLIIFLTTLVQLQASSFSLDKYEINIESNFLGEEIVIFGEKSADHDLLIILEGKGEKVRLNEKVKKKILWTNKSTNYENIPNYFSIFSLPKKTLNEIFLIQTVKNNHRLISDASQKLFKIREALKDYKYQANLCAAIINHANSAGKKLEDDIKQMIQKI